MLILAAGITLAACATPPPALLVRTDGQPIRGNPHHEAALQVDQAVCVGERQKAHMSGVTFSSGSVGAVIAEIDRNNSADAVLAGCFAQRGYVIVPADKADAEAAKFRELAAAKSLAPDTTSTGSIASAASGSR
jgi:hypothetical protein